MGKAKPHSVPVYTIANVARVETPATTCLLVELGAGPVGTVADSVQVIAFHLDQVTSRHRGSGRILSMNYLSAYTNHPQVRREDGPFDRQPISGTRPATSIPCPISSDLQSWVVLYPLVGRYPTLQPSSRWPRGHLSISPASIWVYPLLSGVVIPLLTLLFPSLISLSFGSIRPSLCLCLSHPHLQVEVS